MPSCGSASAGARNPGRAKAGRSALNGQGGCRRARQATAAANGRLGSQLYLDPQDWGKSDRPADGQRGGKWPPCLRGSPGLSSRPPSRLSRPGCPAPLCAFGPGSRSCDVISKASALSSDTQPCPAGLGIQALFTAAWAGRGAEKRAQAPPGETAQAAARVAAPAPTPTASPRAVGTQPPPIRLKPRVPAPRPESPLQSRRAARTVAVFLHFAIPAPSIKLRVGDKSSSISPSRIGRGKTRSGLQKPGHVRRAGDFRQNSPRGGEPYLPATNQQHPSRPRSPRRPGHPGGQPRFEASPSPPLEEKNWRRPMGGQEGS